MFNLDSIKNICVHFINIPLAYGPCRVPLSSQSVPFQLTLSSHLAPSQFTFSLRALLHRHLSVRFQFTVSAQFSVPNQFTFGPRPQVIRERALGSIPGVPTGSLSL